MVGRTDCRGACGVGCFRAGGPKQIDEMCALRVVELQRTCDRVDDALGWAGRVAAFETGVVLARDAGEEGDLFASQTLDPPAFAAIRGTARLRGRDPGAPGGKERTDLRTNIACSDACFMVIVVGCHGDHCTNGTEPVEGPARDPHGLCCVGWELGAQDRSRGPFRVQMTWASSVNAAATRRPGRASTPSS
jgi:hypothetical protein